MSFEFATAGRIIVGPGRAAGFPSVLAGLGSRALICTGSRPGSHAGLLAGLQLPVTVITVAGEPTIESARAAAVTAREHNVDVVAAIGGGSVIDLAKAVAMLLGNGGDPPDYLEVIGSGRKITKPAVPLVAVPTTAGTGAEVTANAVLASPAHRVKASLRSALMIPRVAIVDPLLTLTCPPPVTAASGLDALTQCLEPFVSVRANALTDCFAAAGLRYAGSGLRRAFADGTDVQARTDMALCSLLGGLALANAKLGAVHGLASAVGGAADVPHGAACAALLAPVVEANVRALRSTQPASPALSRYAEAARLLTGDQGAAIEDGIAWVRETVTQLRIRRLREFGLRPEDFGDITASAMKASSTQGNPVSLAENDFRAILAEAV
jgi:alcohol dehydrogenase class IV